MTDIKYYFDNAAATPMFKQVLNAMQPFYIDDFYNPSAIYLNAQSVKAKLYDARKSVAQAIGAKPTEIIFTAGGTEANNLAIAGIMQQYPNKELIVSGIEHESVMLPAKRFKSKIAKVDQNGQIDIAQLKKQIGSNTVLISVMLANNEIGTIQPIKEIVELVQNVRKMRQELKQDLPLYVHTDACQGANYCDINVGRLGIDLMTLNGGKIYGPKQSGVLFLKTGVVLQPLIYGGGQEYGLRSGTENIAQSVGFSVALAKVRSGAKQESKRVNLLKQTMLKELLQNKKITLNGPKNSNRLSNNINICVNGTDNERLLMQLDEAGFMIATGSACSASNDEPSHVLKAIGLSDAGAQSSVRITLGRYSTQESCLLLCKTLLNLVN